MPSPLSAGKQKGLEAVADSHGIIAALLIDQRSALRSLFSRAMGVEAADVPPESLSQFKEAVSSILTPHASAALLDPKYGLPAAGKGATNAGLLLAYEQTGYDKNVPGRMPRLLDRWSVKRLIEAVANAVKLLLHYSSRSSAETNSIKYAFVEKVGAECAASDVPFFLELVSNDTFQFGLQLTAEAGTKFSGVLCGRATWKDGVGIFVKQGPNALQDWLGREGIPTSKM